MHARGEEGFSVAELAVGALVTLVVLAGLAATMVSGFRTTTFGRRQSEALDAARGVLNQVQRDLQGSKQFETCTLPGDPPGSCILIVVQPPQGPDVTVRYRLRGTRLYRDVDDGTGTFPVSTLLSDRVANLEEVPPAALFTCSASGSLLQVAVDMHVQPDPRNSPTFQLHTLVRPRNTYHPPSC